MTHRWAFVSKANFALHWETLFRLLHLYWLTSIEVNLQVMGRGQDKSKRKVRNLSDDHKRKKRQKEQQSEAEGCCTSAEAYSQQLVGASHPKSWYTWWGSWVRCCGTGIRCCCRPQKGWSCRRSALRLFILVSLIPVCLKRQTRHLKLFRFTPRSLERNWTRLSPRLTLMISNWPETRNFWLNDIKLLFHFFLLLVKHHAVNSFCK